MAKRSAHNPPATLTQSVDDFLIDRQARNLSPRTLAWYRHSLRIWTAHAATLGVHTAHAVTAPTLRRFLLDLAERGHNPGGVQNIFGAVKAFLRWYRTEYASPDWVDPLAKVKQPRKPIDPLPPVALEDIRAMLGVCPRSESGDRDRCILLVLLDTGVRHQELADLNLGDLDLSDGSIRVRRGKGGKARTVFVGNRTRQALARYLRRRHNPAPDAPLWLTADGRRLSKAGLREVVRRRARQAGVTPPGMHAFRRAFALNSLRSGMDLVTLARLLGHSNLAIVQRYLAQLDDDLRAAHTRHSAVDHML